MKSIKNIISQYERHLIVADAGKYEYGYSENDVGDMLKHMKEHYEEQIAILSEQVPKGAVDFDKRSFEMKRSFEFKNEIVAALLKYENAKYKPSK